MAELGHEQVDAIPDWAADDVLPDFLRVWRMGPALAGVPFESLEPLNRALAEDAQSTTSAELGLSVGRLQVRARRMVTLWSHVDVLVTPTLALPPVPIGWQFAIDDPRAQFELGYAFTPFTGIANVTGQPAASIPGVWTDDGLPIGAQLIGKPAGDAELLSLCAQIEAARPWDGRRPPSTDGR